MRPSSWPVLLSPSCSCCLPGRPLSFSCWPPPAAFPLVLFLSLASFARLAAVVFFGLLFGAPLLWPFVAVVGVVFVWFLFGLVFLVLFVCLLVVWWAVLAASLLRRLRTTKDCRPQHHIPITVLSCLPSHLEVGPSLSSFFDLLRLSWLLCRLVLLTCWSCCVGGVDCSRPEPWTRLHCSELHWRVPVALPVGQPGAPVSSKDCAHGSFSSCGSEAIWLAHSSGEWCYFWISWLTQWYCYAAMHCRYFAETKTLWEHLNSPAATIQLLRPWHCMFWWRVYCYGKYVIRRCGADHAWLCLRRFPFWRGTVFMSTLRRPFCISGFWRKVTDLALWDRIVVATGPLPAMGRGAMTPGRQRHPSQLLLTYQGTCPCIEHGHMNKYLWEDSERLG